MNKENRVIVASGRFGHSVLKLIIVGDVFHNILDFALKNIAKLIDGIDFYILIMSQAVDLGTIHIIVGVQIVLRDALLPHGFPKTIISDHIRHFLI